MSVEKYIKYEDLLQQISSKYLDNIDIALLNLKCGCSSNILTSSELIHKQLTLNKENFAIIIVDVQDKIIVNFMGHKVYYYPYNEKTFR